MSTQVWIILEEVGLADHVRGVGATLKDAQDLLVEVLRSDADSNPEQDAEQHLGSFRIEPADMKTSKEEVTVETVRADLRRIESLTGDEERAHVAENDLWECVLEELARQGNELAAAALKSRDIKFARWCA
jgi:hypothetical protein